MKKNERVAERGVCKETGWLFSCITVLVDLQLDAHPFRSTFIIVFNNVFTLFWNQSSATNSSKSSFVYEINSWASSPSNSASNHHPFTHCGVTRPVLPSGLCKAVFTICHPSLPRRSQFHFERSVSTDDQQLDFFREASFS